MSQKEKSSIKLDKPLKSKEMREASEGPDVERLTEVAEAAKSSIKWTEDEVDSLITVINEYYEDVDMDDNQIIKERLERILCLLEAAKRQAPPTMTSKIDKEIKAYTEELDDFDRDFSEYLGEQ